MDDVSDATSLVLESLDGDQGEVDIGDGFKVESSETQGGTSSFSGAYFNFVNSIVGAGIIGMPYAIHHCGFYLGVFLLCFVGYITYFSVNLLVETGEKLRRYSYEEIVEISFGSTGKFFIVLFQFLLAFGAQIAYGIVIGDTMTDLIAYFDEDNPLTNRPLVVFIYSTCFILPLCLLRDMSSLSYSSALSIFAVVFIVFAVAIQGPTAGKDQNIKHNFDVAESSWFGGLGAISFAFVCHHSSFLVFNSLEKKTIESWNHVSFWAVMTATTLCLLMGIFGYYAFDQTAKGDILNNFDYNDPVINVARALLAFTMVFTFPMEQYVSRHCIYIYLLPHGEQASFNQHLLVTLAIWGFATVIGMCMSDVGIVLELTGAVAASVVAYIFPPLCYLRVCGWNNSWNEFKDIWMREGPYTFRAKILASYKFAFCILIISFGTVAGLAGTITAFIDASN